MRTHVYFFLNFFYVYLFILRQRAWAGQGQREREGERIISRLCTVSIEPNAGLELKNCKLNSGTLNLNSRTWAEIKSQILNLLNHPGTLHPCVYLFLDQRLLPSQSLIYTDILWRLLSSQGKCIYWVTFEFTVNLLKLAFRLKITSKFQAFSSILMCSQLCNDVIPRLVIKNP